MEPPPAGLTPFQVAVADLFFSLPESDGFLLAGGAALAAQHLTTRPTQDLDLFTRAGRGTVPAARNAFENAAASRGWSVRRIRNSDTFCRLVVTGDDDLLVDLVLGATVGEDVGVMLAAAVWECRRPRPVCGAGPSRSGWRCVVHRVVVIIPGFIRR